MNWMIKGHVLAFYNRKAKGGIRMNDAPSDDPEGRETVARRQ
ncbi:hypothetical protein FTV88_3119 [Heliorestis convoluta]|uniref:Uncharacterized protein n=1 Tax=Heliorestis convoluta TaxID=356322 RepID=A0A5Q2N1E6_9FIRM|nr:hypothetical protein [Heliorestis convoluta]QGG49194.1 hypothetical protein FTV88_3119 [Heliorestis convoluta]